MDDLISAREAERLLRKNTGYAGYAVKRGLLRVAEFRKPASGRGRPAQQFRRADVERLVRRQQDHQNDRATATNSRRAKRAAKSAELAGLTGGGANYLPLAEREDPVVSYGLLTAGDMAELTRRRARAT